MWDKILHCRRLWVWWMLWGGEGQASPDLVKSSLLVYSSKKLRWSTLLILRSSSVSMVERLNIL